MGKSKAKQQQKNLKPFPSLPLPPQSPEVWGFNFKIEVSGRLPGSYY